MRASSSLVSMLKVTEPSMSAGERPASRMAAIDASEASWRVERPEFWENSVWPMPAMTARRPAGMSLMGSELIGPPPSARRAGTAAG